MMWAALITGFIALVLVVLGLFRLSEPCKRCGSRLKDSPLRDEDGRFADAVCGMCGFRWCPEWVKRARERGE
jgi:hypothetical protein